MLSKILIAMADLVSALKAITVIAAILSAVALFYSSALSKQRSSNPLQLVLILFLAVMALSFIVKGCFTSGYFEFDVPAK